MMHIQFLSQLITSYSQLRQPTVFFEDTLQDEYFDIIVHMFVQEQEEANSV